MQFELLGLGGHIIIYRLLPLPPTSTATDDWMFGCSEAWEDLEIWVLSMEAAWEARSEAAWAAGMLGGPFKRVRYP